MERATKVVHESASTGGANPHPAFLKEWTPSIGQAKARQSNKIKELKVALTRAGLHTIDEQARALGLCRSTTWSVLKGDHKSSGLSSSTINRMLLAPELPSSVRTKIIEYVEERTAGLYGHGPAQMRRFRTASAWADQISDAAQNPLQDATVHRT